MEVLKSNPGKIFIRKSDNMIASDIIINSDNINDWEEITKQEADVILKEQEEEEAKLELELEEYIRIQKEKHSKK